MMILELGWVKVRTLMIYKFSIFLELVLGQFHRRLFNPSRRVQKKGGLLIILVKALYRNIMRKAEAIQFGRYQQVTSAVEIKMVHSMKFNLLKKPN